MGVIAMPATVASPVRETKLNPRFLPVIDRVLITGLNLGPLGKHEAINKVLQLVPEWKRGDGWRRVRQLRRRSVVPGIEAKPPQSRSLRSQKSESHARPAARPWTNEDDAKLLHWAGYEPVSRIAQRLNRSVRAVRFRLGALGMSARVSDVWSLRSLRKLLRVSPARLRYFIGSGMLRVRDPRISTKSLLQLYAIGGLPPGNSSREQITAGSSKQRAHSWDHAAEFLGIPIEQIQAMISKGKLKVLDPFVTDRLLEEFCRKHGDQINLALIDPATAKWRVSEYGVSRDINVPVVSRAQKHAFVVRTCTCGRKISGNIFFKHTKHCRELRARGIGATA